MLNSLKNMAKIRKMIPQKYLPVFARVRIQAPHVFVLKLIPQEFFPACIGFVPGGTLKNTGKLHCITRLLVDSPGETIGSNNYFTPYLRVFCHNGSLWGVNTGRFGKIVFLTSFERFFDPLSH